MYNPLDHIAQVKEEPMKSESSWQNDRPGFCPKCQAPFGTAIAGNKDTVFFCESCCLTHPMPNA